MLLSVTFIHISACGLHYLHVQHAQYGTNKQLCANNKQQYNCNILCITNVDEALEMVFEEELANDLECGGELYIGPAFPLPPLEDQDSGTFNFSSCF